MGVYYQISNSTKREVICVLAGNIKQGAYTCWSPQLAILSEFLGAPSPFHWPDFQTSRRWSNDQIRIENDGEPEESQADLDGWPDVGAEYLKRLHKGGTLTRWLTFHSLGDCPSLIEGIKDEIESGGA